MNDSIINPWLVDESDYPADGSATEKLRFLLNYAVLAPSRYNSQPWLFKITGNDLRLYADRTRSLPASDPDDRALVLGCGAALYYLRLAIQYFGHTARVHTFPDLNDEDLLALVQIGPKRPPSLDVNQLFRAMTRCDAVGEPTRAAKSMPTILDPDIARYGVELHTPVLSEQHLAMEQIVAAANDRMLRSEVMEQERSLWTRSAYHSPSQNGTAGGYGASEVTQNGYGIRHTSGQQARETGCGDQLLVVSTPGDNTASWLAAGQALAYVMLRSSVAGLCSVPLHAPVELPDVRAAIVETLELHGYPQVVMKGNACMQLTHETRRPVHDVLLTQRQI